MSTKNYIWLISSKDIAELNGDTIADKRCVHTGNSDSFNIFDSEYNNINKKISLGLFYYDLYLKYYNKYLKEDEEEDKGPFIENMKFYLKKSEEIDKSDKIAINPNEIICEFKNIKGIEKTTEILNWDVFKLKGHNVFFTRCFPTILNNSIGLHKAQEYWLLSYFLTVCRILEINNLKNYTFNFILHDKDINEKGEGHDVLFKDIIDKDFPSQALGFPIEDIRSLESRIYYFEHTNSSFYYENIIANSNFFDNCEDANTRIETGLNIENYIKEFKNLLNG